MTSSTLTAPSSQAGREAERDDGGWSSQWHSIREASLYCGLPESTLRYYEQIGIITGIGRDPISGHRVYSDDNLEELSTIACLSATGMPLKDMREYMSNRSGGQVGAAGEVELLRRQRDRLEEERDFLEARGEYVSLKIEYWDAVSQGDEAKAQSIGEQAAKKARSLGQRAAQRKAGGQIERQHTVK